MPGYTTSYILVGSLCNEHPHRARIKAAAEYNSVSLKASKTLTYDRVLEDFVPTALGLRNVLQSAVSCCSVRE